MRLVHPLRLSTRLCLVLGLPMVALACRDPRAGPPETRRDPGATQRIALHRLSQAPSPQLQGVAGPVSFGGGRLEWLGADLGPSPALPGRPLRITHYWRCLAPVDVDYRVLVHLERPGQAGVLVNGDHTPLGGFLPTSRWRAGEIYRDTHRVELPRAPGARLALRVGLYRGEERLPVDAPRAHDGAHRALAGELPVAASPPPPTLWAAPAAAGAIKVDGRLDEPAWAWAPVVTLEGSAGQGAPELATFARLLATPEGLVVGFEAEDTDAWSPYGADDAPLYEAEVVELFVDADGAGGRYQEFQVAPTGHTFDARFSGPRSGMELGWSAGMEAAVEVLGEVNDRGDEDGGWRVELRVPWGALEPAPRLPPRPGDRWKINLYRLEHHGRRRVEGSAASAPRVPDFHHLPRFATLEFLDQRP